jgi:Ala-tRNA(Pro) deacylase
MPIQRLKNVLNQNGIKYVTLKHSPAYTAQEIAAAAHIPGKELAETVILKLDGIFAMAVLPASCQIDFELLKDAFSATRVELATEDEFEKLFPNCEAGAMPPFGNLYGMHVYVAPELAEDEYIAFNAGSHSELIQMRYVDFEDLVQPQELFLATVSY